ncbi:DUF4270 domain-containing protein [Tamlana fucoidanivorans]|uniref:DUF4270 domain-containing protein n=1 Tax=Allotamlana fucoidanivorans TaxID=2583814 RepID=A0A5C4SP14_9FLAO|nr:DUF4270 domain-containing protein [Tamlana fucoidanivorans]TNJ45390.1 DUF4270 domain-containing protein [Tamlana fucoidanivorans]
MKKTINALKFPFVFLLVLVALVACDKEFNVIESDVLGKDNANFTTGDTLLPVVAYNQKLSALQINRLGSTSTTGAAAASLLGVYNDPAYGLTKASIISQVTPTSFNPDFGENPQVVSVVLNIPYYSTANGTDDEGHVTYKLDSLYGNTEQPIKLTIYQNNYFLRDFDPNSVAENSQNYYSNGSSDSNSALTGTSTILFDNHIVNVDTPIFVDNEFIPSNEAIVIETGEGDDAVTSRSEPAFRVELDNDFWQQTILDKQDDPVLSNANNFKNYFRGLYFKAETLGIDDGSMILLNLASSKATITITYEKGPTDARTESTYTLNFSGNRLTTFINNFTTNLENGDAASGDEKLYLKGMEGSMAIVDLFSGDVDCDGDGIPDMDALECFKQTYRQTDENGEYRFDPLTRRFLLKRLINEAHLIINEDEDMNTGDDEDYHKYDRIYAYDLENKASTIDYIVDQSGNTVNPVNSKIISLGQRNSEGTFKIRLTQHLNNILLNDSTNTKIGLVLSTNVNYTNNSKILNSANNVDAIPTASIISPRGTILYGSKGIPEKEDKKLQLKIFLSKGKED